MTRTRCRCGRIASTERACKACGSTKHIIYDWDEAVAEFRHQMQFGWYDSAADPDWHWGYDDLDVATVVAEARWRVAWRHYVPSRLWDPGTPSIMTYISLEAASRTPH